MGVDLDEHRLVGRHAVDVDAGTVLKSQTPWRQLGVERCGDASKNQRLGVPLLKRVTLMRHRSDRT
jgi:hypothetical protein